MGVFDAPPDHEIRDKTDEANIGEFFGDQRQEIMPPVKQGRVINIMVNLVFRDKLIYIPDQ